MKAKDKLNKEECVDLVLDILISAYALGIDDVNEQFGLNKQPSIEQSHEAIYKRIDEKDFADRVGEYAEQGDIPSIMRVADTDAHRCYNTGAYDTALLSGAKTKTWKAVMDEKTRDTHWYLDGTTVGIDDYFYSISGDKAQYPLGFETPQENVNCRCIVTFK